MRVNRRLILIRQFYSHFIRRMYNKWNDDSVFFSAAAISFNVMITILPLGLLMISLTSFGFKGSLELQNAMGNWLDQANPFMSEEIRNDIESVMFAGNQVTGVIGIITLFWLARRLFGTIRTAFDRIFDVPVGRHVVLGFLYDFILALLVAFCFVVAFLLTTASAIVVDSPLGKFVEAWPVIGPLIGKASAKLLAFTFTTMLFLTLFKAAPNRKISWRQALLATAVVVIFFDMGTRLYTWFVSRPDWGIVYGSLATVMATFFWLYWSCVILLGAGEVSQVVHEWSASRKGMKHLEEVSKWGEIVTE